MSSTAWVRASLTARGIPFEELHHAPAYTAQQVAAREHVSGARVAKVVAAVADGRFVELILPASRRVDLERVKEVLGAKEARLASEEEMEKVFTGCEVGATPALRHWEGLPVLMDRMMPVEGDVVIQAGSHTDAIRLPLREWYELVNPQVVSFSRPEAD
jgi:Ala-tRNA(Pro) deacylase